MSNKQELGIELQQQIKQILPSVGNQVLEELGSRRFARVERLLITQFEHKLSIEIDLIVAELLG